VHFCPEEAIDFPEVVSGEWFVSETRHGPLVHARLGIAAENSGKLVSVVRNEAKALAKERNLDLLLVDGPPGIGCPVIASLTGASVAVVVTEPTVSGVHDLKRVVGLAGFFHLPVLVCINKYDINETVSDEIQEYCRDEGLTFVGKIPYDPEVTAAQLAATSVVEHNSSPSAEAIRETWENIQLSLTSKKT
jgi:MinD superfamily P-loop ATPase